MDGGLQLHLEGHLVNVTTQLLSTTIQRIIGKGKGG